jgi:hypothetical protein
MLRCSWVSHFREDHEEHEEHGAPSGGRRPSVGPRGPTGAVRSPSGPRSPDRAGRDRGARRRAAIPERVRLRSSRSKHPEASALC